MKGLQMKELGLITNVYKKKEYPNDLGKRSKLGGDPEWIQESEKIICSKCGKNMNFVSQLDSIDYTGDIDKDAEYMFGDVGMIYTFFCFDCIEVKSLVQTY